MTYGDSSAATLDQHSIPGGAMSLARIVTRWLDEAKGRSLISNAIGGWVILGENFCGSSKAEAGAGAVV